MRPSVTLPTGTVTFLFTDIEGSTTLLQRLGPRYGDVLDEHRRLLREAFDRHQGHEMGTEGDSFFVAFAQASGAAAAAVDAQLALNRHPWPENGRICVRIGMHTGEATLRERDYVGLAVHEAARVSAAAHGGQVLLTRVTADLVGDSLPDGAAVRTLGSHRLKDLIEPVELLQLSHPDLPGSFPPPRSLEARPNNLPLQLTSFVGREQEMIEVRKAIEHARLVTITGAGGAGKTRLALEVATELLDDFAHGVWFVDLSGIAEESAVGAEIARAVGLLEWNGDVIDALARHLGTKDVLVVVDNCEHVLTTCAAITSRVLANCGRVRVIATSREPLGIAGEVSWRIPSLDMPDEGDVSATETAAVRLFVERARNVRRDFELSTQEATDVARICRRLDGIPLAIELAAARVRSLSPAAIADRLDDRFRLLVGGSRTAVPRQRTLEALVDWSYNLLDDAERTALRRLSVFAGSFSLEGAEAVCTGAGIERDDVLLLLEALIDKSLVQTERGGLRYRMLETIRQYARYKLLEAAEADTVRRRHLEFYVDLAGGSWRDALWGSKRAETIDLLEAEHDNFRAALEWGAEASPDVALRLAGPLSWVWWLRGYIVEAARWLDSLLAMCPAQTIDRAAALSVRAFLSLAHEADYGLVERRAAEAVEIARALPDDRERAWVLAWGLAARADVASTTEEAEEFAREALAIGRQAGEPMAEARALQSLGSAIANRGDLSEALAVAEEALALCRAFDIGPAVVRLLLTVARLALGTGDPHRAVASAYEALEVSRAAADKPGEAIALNYLGGVLKVTGDFQGALRYGRQSVEFARKWGDMMSLVNALNHYGYAAAVLEDYEAATAAHDEAVAIARAHDLPFLPGILHSRGEIAQAMDDLDTAKKLYEECRSLAAARRDDQTVAMVDAYLAQVAFRRGDIEDADHRARAALSGQSDSVARWAAVHALACVAVATGRPERAAHLKAGADATRLRGGIGIVVLPESSHDDLRRRVADALASDQIEQIERDVATWTTEQIVAYALDE